MQHKREREEKKPNKKQSTDSPQFMSVIEPEIIVIGHAGC